MFKPTPEIISIYDDILKLHQSVSHVRYSYTPEQYAYKSSIFQLQDLGMTREHLDTLHEKYIPLFLSLEKSVKELVAPDIDIKLSSPSYPVDDFNFSKHNFNQASIFFIELPYLTQHVPGLSQNFDANNTIIERPLSKACPFRPPSFMNSNEHSFKDFLTHLREHISRHRLNPIPISAIVYTLDHKILVIPPNSIPSFGPCAHSIPLIHHYLKTIVADKTLYQTKTPKSLNLFIPPTKL